MTWKILSVLALVAYAVHAYPFDKNKVDKFRNPGHLKDLPIIEDGSQFEKENNNYEKPIYLMGRRSRMIITKLKPTTMTVHNTNMIMTTNGITTTPAITQTPAATTTPKTTQETTLKPMTEGTTLKPTTQETTTTQKTTTTKETTTQEITEATEETRTTEENTTNVVSTTEAQNESSFSVSTVYMTSATTTVLS
ncbi:PREDICTED: platelet glycoprotein Ib alpha chain-like [Ceratosolen solmsi marchali]|uniref:Platelet glycoprotein Ib alpha chain-like n=1 Tax=Ceratosolen solmsi marchali TaxID=326594 RepID=A0AAJ7DXA1_9HYME|nr:PREDICTED: platelet glycoprotein Ib alpha chain-like [Ceratosolen solmsi marchali]